VWPTSSRRASGFAISPYQLCFGRTIGPRPFVLSPKLSGLVGRNRAGSEAIALRTSSRPDRAEADERMGDGVITRAAVSGAIAPPRIQSPRPCRRRASGSAAASRPKRQLRTIIASA